MRHSAYSETDRELVLAVGERLRKVRHDMDLSLNEMAMIVGVSAHQLNAYERGKNCPRLPVLARIATALNASVVDLLEGVC